MADKEAMFQVMSSLITPDGARYVYAQAAEDLEMGQFIEPHKGTQRIIKLKGKGLRMPRGIACETVPKEYYSFFMVQEPQTPAQMNPSGGVIVDGK
jgi:hypothetical protein